MVHRVIVPDLSGRHVAVGVMPRSSASSTAEVSQFLLVLLAVYLACGVASPHEFVGCFALARWYLMIAALHAVAHDACVAEQEHDTLVGGVVCSKRSARRLCARVGQTDE
jgi:hypothetical protein